MLTRFRALGVALALGALLLGHAAPAAARTDDFARVRETPILLDAMILRPIGLIMTGFGLALAPLPMGITLVTRPTDVFKPFKVLVLKPARYTFVDPLGSH